MSVFVHQQSMVLQTVIRLSWLHLDASQRIIALFVTVQVSTSRNCWVVWLLSTLHTFFFAFIASIAIIFTFDGFVDLSSQVLFTGHCISSAFFVFLFQVELKAYVSFVLLQPARVQLLECSFFITAASLATLHKRLPRELQRVSVELVW